MSDPFSSQLLRMAKDEGYALGVQYSMQRLAQSERILTDLIADLRDTYDDESDWHRVEHMYRAMYRAEARLREVGGDDADV